nr:DNA methyltransferase [Clostridium sp. AM45-5]
MLKINKIYNQDCLDGMKLLDDHSIDLICTDLPYGVTQNKSDIVIPFEPLWEQYERIIKENGAIVLFCQGMFYIDLVDSNRKLFRYDLVWDKILTTGFLNAKKMPLRQHEQIAVFYKKLPVYNPQFTVGKPLHSHGNKACAADKITNNNYGSYVRNDDSRAGSTEKYPTSIIRVQKSHPSKAKHRTEKPR